MLATTVFFVIFTSNLIAQQSAVQFLLFPPDARHSGMGNIGAATSPDASANFTNVAKLAFTDRLVGGNLTRYSLLKNLVDGMYVTNISVYFKPKANATHVLGLYHTAFNQGTINFTSPTGQPAGTYNTREQATGLNYAKKIAKNISLGIGLKYIHSALNANIIGNTSTKPAKTIAGDLSIFGINGNADKFNLKYGLALSNVGGKINYGRDAYFLPTNIRAGISPTFQKNKNRLLVGFDVVKNFYNAPFNGLFYSIGTEYSYNNYFAGRFGYFNDSSGGRKYFTMGIGGRIMKQFGLDFAYRIGKSSPFHKTAQLSFVFDFKSNNKEVVQSL